jgi:hypothetical protein
MEKDIENKVENYMNHHLAGASGALLLIRDLIERAECSEASEFFVNLKARIEADRSKLEALVCLVGKQSSAWSKAAGKMAASIGSLKLMWDGFAPEKLGMLEALELLALGVQGKRLLWRALREVSHCFPEWSGTDFNHLENDAIDQRDGVEMWRLWAARQTFCPSKGSSEVSH